MRITQSLVQNAHTRLNVMGEFEISLRGLNITAIENFGLTKNLFFSIDLSHNSIQILENFPRMENVKSMFLNCNNISVVSPSLGLMLPELKILVLTDNKISDLKSIENISKFDKLEHLSLVENPIRRVKEYRLYVIWLMPSLKSLDFRKISNAERKKAKERFRKSDNKENERSEKTEVLTAKEKKILKNAIKNAKNIETVEKIGTILNRGCLMEGERIEDFE
ncbi:U2 snRNP complex subunit [Bonamia ostreae]|uniref:U2 snRNP complex subunit n=1 Tax=Bonamia ostreae TaxID=126728 RepID=A0ABV2AQF1_9EUKA